jgi:hypothetical protein
MVVIYGWEEKRLVDELNRGFEEMSRELENGAEIDEAAAALDRAFEKLNRLEVWQPETKKAVWRVAGMLKDQQNDICHDLAVLRAELRSRGYSDEELDAAIKRVEAER